MVNMTETACGEFPTRRCSQDHQHELNMLTHKTFGKSKFKHRFELKSRFKLLTRSNFWQESSDLAKHLLLLGGGLPLLLRHKCDQLGVEGGVVGGGGGQHGVHLLLLGCVNSGQGEDGHPGDGDQGEAVHERPKEGGQVGCQGKLGRLKVILNQEQSLGGGSCLVDVAGSLGEDCLHLLLGHLQVEALHLGQGVLAGLLEQAHQVDIELGAKAKEDKAEAKVGSDCYGGVAGEGDEEEEARACDQPGEDWILPPEDQTWSHQSIYPA